LRGKRRRGWRHGERAEAEFDTFSFFLSFVQGDSYPGLCAQRTLRVEDLFCCGDDRGPKPVSFFLRVIGGHVYISLWDERTLSKTRRNKKIKKSVGVRKVFSPHKLR